MPSSEVRRACSERLINVEEHCRDEPGICQEKFVIGNGSYVDGVQVGEDLGVMHASAVSCSIISASVASLSLRCYNAE